MRNGVERKRGISRYVKNISRYERGGWRSQGRMTDARPNRAELLSRAAQRICPILASWRDYKWSPITPEKKSST